MKFNLIPNVGGTALGWVDEPQPTWSKTSGKARTYAPLGFGWGDITPTNWIFNEFQLEKTIDGKLDPRIEASIFFNHSDSPSYKVYTRTWAQTGFAATDIRVKKYLNYKTEKDETEWRSGIHERVLRYADILLLYAECLNELNQTNDSYTYIQIVRDRANLPDLATSKPGMTQQDMRWQIAHERALELCFEAQRYVDILRWGWHDNNATQDTLIAHDAEFSKWKPGREYLAIPIRELDYNRNLKQNPGW